MAKDLEKKLITCSNGGSSPVGNVILASCYGISPKLLNNAEKLKQIILKGLSLENYTILPGEIKYSFTPFGATIMIGISESGFEVHTWPEHKTAAFTFYTCRSQTAGRLAMGYVIHAVKAKELIQVDEIPLIVNPKHTIKEKDHGRLHLRNINLEEYYLKDVKGNPINIFSNLPRGLYKLERFIQNIRSAKNN